MMKPQADLKGRLPGHPVFMDPLQWGPWYEAATTFLLQQADEHDEVYGTLHRHLETFIQAQAAPFSMDTLRRRLLMLGVIERTRQDTTRPGLVFVWRIHRVTLTDDVIRSLETRMRKQQTSNRSRYGQKQQKRQKMKTAVDMLMKERDELLKERAESTRLVERLQQQLVHASEERDELRAVVAVFEKRDALSAEPSTDGQERDALRFEREELMRDRDELITERNRLQQQLTAVLTERDLLAGLSKESFPNEQELVTLKQRVTDAESLVKLLLEGDERTLQLVRLAQAVQIS